MKPSEQERLWREIFADEKLAELRGAALESGLAALRQKRRRRIVVPTAAAAGLAAVVTVATVWRRPQPAPAIPAPKAEVVSSASASSIKYLDDQQLFALFPNRAAALIGPPGEQQFVFLDGRGAAP